MIKPASLLPKSDAKGMTLVELLVVVGLVLVVVGAGISPYLFQQEYLRRQFIRNRLQDDASIAMSYITRDIFRAKAIITGAFPSNSLQLTIGTGPLPVNEINVVYNLVGTNITYAVGGNPAQIIASHITGLQFDRTGAENFYLTITITANRDDQTITMTSGTALRAVRPV